MVSPGSSAPSLLKRRLFYALVTGLVLITGYLSRKWSVRGSLIHDYAGDAIWAGMIYFGFRCLSPAAAPGRALTAALIATYLIEITQLYQAPWLNTVRHTWLGGLILGYVFLWSDLLMYSLGILSAWLADRFFRTRLPP
ncbi:MAG: DUF2809 domain-containing protein [Verrucomicrobiota bacterium]